MPKNARCNGISECIDRSDERDCDIVITDSEYFPQIAPNPGNYPLEISLKINVTNIRNLKIVGFELKVDATIFMKWKDNRLTFVNLKKETEKNRIANGSAIWTPMPFMEDSNKSPVDVYVKARELKVMRESDSLPDDDSNFMEGNRDTQKTLITHLYQQILILLELTIH